MFFNKAALAATALSAAMLAAPIAPAGAVPAGMTAHLAGSVAGFDNSTVTKVHYRRRHHRHRRHPGYRRHSDGFWYPLAAFGALGLGAAIAGAGDRNSRHVEWCDDRYRSYDPATDTFQPYEGPRRRCNSPYDGY